MGNIKTNRAKDFAMMLLDEAKVELNGPRPDDLQVYDERFWETVVRDRELGLGESYQQGWWGAEHLDQLLVKILNADLKNKVKPSIGLVAFALGSKLKNHQTVRRAARNASSHYDIGNDLYERMLDKRMLYSCAYWKDAEDLGAAQEAKLDLICRKLDLQPGMTLLDIGCGWGGMAAFAAERYGAKVTAISPALQQVTVAAKRCEGLDVDVRQQDYRDVTGKFDRIISVGMLEHVGPKNFRGFFDVNSQLLTEDGIILHHTIGSNLSKSTTDPWFDKYVFPGGVVPSMAHLGKASETNWAIEDVHNFGPDYDRTLMSWYHNIEAVWDDLPNYDEHFRRTWRYYLLSSAASFRARQLQLWQIVFRRARVVSPGYITVR